MKFKLLFYIILNFLIKNIKSDINLNNGYGFGLVEENSKCLSFIGDINNQPLCFNKLIDNKLIYSTYNKTNQIQALKIVEQSFKQLTFLQGKCLNLNYAQFGICEIYFPSCVETTYEISLPKRLCKSVCDKMVNDCPFLSSSLNCSDSNKFPPIGTLYNLTKYGYTDNNGFYKVECSDPTNFYLNSPNDQFIEICPSPLLLRNHSNSEYKEDKGYTYLSPTNCVFSCPQPFYKKNKWDQMFKMSKVLSTISFVCSIYNILTFGILSKIKSKYNLCITFFSISTVLMSLMDIVTYGIGYQEMLCPEPGRNAIQSDAACGVTGAFFHIGITTGVLWWTTMSICLYSEVKRFQMISFRYIILFNSIVSLIILIIPLSGQAFMSGTGSLGCWIRKTWYVNGSFWIPCGIALFIGAICIVLVIYEIFKISKNLSKDNKTLMFQIRPFLCVLLVGGSFLYLFIFNFNNERNLDKYKASIPNYIQCLLSSSVNGQDCLTDGPGFGAYFSFYFFTRLFGITSFCIYGTSKIARDIWFESAYNHPFFHSYIVKCLSLLGISKHFSSNSSGSNPKNFNRNGSNFNMKQNKQKSTIDQNDSISVFVSTKQDIEQEIENNVVTKENDSPNESIENTTSSKDSNASF
ncbi:hypothetical protein RB653_001898 [Dictyostelium firmibasis]|uniref:Uncharacterized protein n=1 Tax=Dictyostelium firmibasis TaxID=79012 RepID=A0AAN7YPK9_9MYCE